MVRKNLCGLTAGEIFSMIEPSGFDFHHAVMIANNIYKKHLTDFSHFAKIPGKLKNELLNSANSGIFKPSASEISEDRTIKYLFRNEMGQEYETVYIPDEKRKTVCVSTQAGCRMGCPFCVTGKYGFRGNLTAGDIINQVISLTFSEKITHVVFMGMGEPMDNLENVLKACEILTSEWGLAISPRNVTVSTVGITPAVNEFLSRSDCNLTLSLHSPFPGERKKVVPVETRYPVTDILEIMKHYPLKKKRRLSLAYVMIKDLNDTESHLEALISLVKGSVIRVNLLPYHPAGEDDNMSSSLERMHYFKHNLIISGISASVRKTRGKDISAACGLLASGLRRMSYPESTHI
jgi:23S rRNA (adenine2503-C2)-methyltransferase